MAIERRFPHLEEDWKSSAAYDQFYQSFKLIGKKRATAYLFELDGPRCRYPVFGYSELSNLQGENRFFPNSPYFFPCFKGRHMPISLYKTDGSNCAMPLYFRGRFVSEKGLERKVHVLLHGFPFPHKWHYDVLKHMQGHPQFGMGKDERVRWEAFEGAQVALPEPAVFEKCKANQADTSCDMVNCSQNNLFPKVHPHIKENCLRFFKKAVTFWAEQTTKKITVWQGNPFSGKSDPHVMQIISENKVDYTSFAIALAKKTGRKLDVERCDKLIVRGFSHDWSSAPEPTVHLHIVTLFAGELRGARPEIDHFDNHGGLVDRGFFHLDTMDA